MGKVTDIVELGLIAFILLMVSRGFTGLTSWFKGLEEKWKKEREQLITPTETQNIWYVEKENIDRITTYIAQTGNQQVATAIANNNIQKLMELKAKYQKNIEDFTNWYREAWFRLQEVNKFIAINSVNPVCWLNPSCKTALESAKSEKIDLENKMQYYTEQVEINKKLLNDVKMSGVDC